MKVLIISAHPSLDSFNALLSATAISKANEFGHEVRHHDLYEEKFNPVFSSYERLNHVGDIQAKLESLPELRQHVEDLQWCDIVIFVYPTWWSAQPAILKGWIDRVLMNEVAWVLPAGAARIRPLLTNISRIIVITTHGSSKLVNSVQGESGKRTMFRSVRLMMNLRTRSMWLAMYGLDTATESQRHKFISRVERRLRRALL